jgi:hypothetical protein
MGSETTASIKNFHRLRENASQYASGTPMISRMAETMMAKRSVSVSA